MLRTLTTARRNAMGCRIHNNGTSTTCVFLYHCKRFGGIALMQQHQQSILRGEMDKMLTSADAMRRMSSSSTTTSTPSTSSKNEDESMAKCGENIYNGAFSATVKRVKMLSLGSLGATVLGCPLLIELSSGASLDMPSKIVLAGSMSSIGAFTTIMLHWFVSPYIRRLWVDSETKTKVTAEKTSLLLQTYYSNFDVKDMKVCDSSHPLVTWEANGEKYYVEPASTSEETYTLLQLQRFEPDTSKDAPMGYDEDEDEDENKKEN